MSVFNPRRFAALLVKETLQIMRDPSSLLIAFALPPFLLFLFGYAINLDTARTRIGLAMLDDSAAAFSLEGAFQNSPWFDVKPTRSVAPLKLDLVAGRVRGIVVIPEDFGRLFASGSADIEVITDGSPPNTASFIAGYAEGVRQSWAAGQAAERGGSPGTPPIRIAPRYWFNPELSSRLFLVPGAMAIVLTIHRQLPISISLCLSRSVSSP